MTLLRWTALALLPPLLIGCGGAGAVGPSTIAKTLRIVVLGDSISKREVLPSSTVPCGIQDQPPCNYSSDGSKAYPALIAQQTGDRVDNLAQSGSLSIGNRIVDGVLVAGVIKMIARIPLDSDVVVWESGLNDIGFFGRGAPSSVPIVATAIKARVPNARVIVLDVRYFSGCSVPGNCTLAQIDAWDAREQLVAMTNGWTFIDLRHVWPAGVSADWPDGRHPGPLAVQKLAVLVEEAINAAQ